MNPPMKTNIEIEVRFLDINPSKLHKRLHDLGAIDKGEDFNQDIVFYDKELSWQKEANRILRLRKKKNGVYLTYKYFMQATPDGTTEIEIMVDDYQKTKDLLEASGFVAFREQEKRRHTYLLGRVIVDIDHWPQIPPLVELEGESEEDLKEAAAQLGLDWNKADMHSVAWALENVYHIPVRKLRYYTFDKVE